MTDEEMALTARLETSQQECAKLRAELAKSHMLEISSFGELQDMSAALAEMTASRDYWRGLAKRLDAELA